MSTILKKLSSRKLWLAIAGVATGIAMVFGLDENIISTVAGATTAVVSVIVYIITEGTIDAAALGKVQTAQTAVGQAVSAVKTTEETGSTTDATAKEESNGNN